MSGQTPNEATQCAYAGILGDSEDSEEEPCLDTKQAVAWEDLPILERLGLSSGADMTEEEVESAFTQLAMAYHCDQYTLSRRLEAEEHDRIVAQENLTLELQRSKDTLQALRSRCVDSKRSGILSRIESSLDTVLGSMDDIISAAETLGAVHQEARVSCSVKLMEIHVEHLKRRHNAEGNELIETRKLVHRSRGRIQSDSAEDGDIRHLFVRQGSQQHLMRRRVSFTLLPTQTQLNDLEAKFLEGCRVSAETDAQGPDSQGADAKGSDNNGPDSQEPNTQGLVTQGSDSQGPNTERPDNQGAETQGPNTQGLVTQGPNSQRLNTERGDTQEPDTQRADNQEPAEGAVVQTTRQTEALPPCSPSHFPAGHTFLFRRSSSQCTQEEEYNPSPRHMVLRHRLKSAILEREGSTEEAEVSGSTPQSVIATNELSELSTADSVSTAEQSFTLSEHHPLDYWLSLFRRILLVMVICLLCFLLVVVSLVWGLKSKPHWTGNTAI